MLGRAFSVEQTDEMGAYQSGNDWGRAGTAGIGPDRTKGRVPTSIEACEVPEKTEFTEYRDCSGSAGKLGAERGGFGCDSVGGKDGGEAAVTKARAARSTTSTPFDIWSKPRAGGRTQRLEILVMGSGMANGRDMAMPTGREDAR